MTTDVAGMTPFPDFNPSNIRELDVRDILRAGGEPLPAILAAAGELPTGWVLHLRSPFQPVPLFGVMAGRGFRHHTTMFAGDDWSTWFWRAEDEDAVTRDAGAAPSAPTRTPVPDGAWDLRDLPPPEPLLAILARVQDTSDSFTVVLPMAPAPLAALLDGQGWGLRDAETLDDGSVVVTMYCGRPAANGGEG